MQEKVNNLNEVNQNIQNCISGGGEVLACEDAIAIGKVAEGDCQSLDLYCQK
jgi:predicted peroxiredoxin